VRERDVLLPDGRTLHAYATEGDDTATAILWHHGTPNLGAPPAPLFAVAQRLGLRWIAYDRPGYGGSTERPGRTVADAAGDAAAVADALGVERFAVMGHSGGGPHALACAALLGDRVTAAVVVSGLAPPDADGLDWYAGMIPSGVASLRAAAAGREAKARFEAEHGSDYDPQFTAGDLAALAGAWSWFQTILAPGAPGLLDDDIAYISPWGVDPAAIGQPVLLLHGDADGIAPPAHARWLASHLPAPQLRLTPGDGHLSVLTHAPDALAWIAARSA
jgi:pimeloyl-ACP methyl ester carboxylesterase